MSDKSALDANQGSIGSQFNPDKGKLAGAAEQVGGPFDREGAVGKQFTTQGAVGGAAQDSAENPPIFDKDGAVGKHFKADGSLGGTAEAIGGPLSSSGMVGKHFTESGAIGGTIQDKLGENKST